VNGAQRGDRPPARARQIGPIGTAARVAGGLGAVAVPAAVSGITWWDVTAALVVLPLTAAVAAAAISAVLTAQTAARRPVTGAAKPSIRSPFFSSS
jgi:hypothetical protein